MLRLVRRMSWKRASVLFPKQLKQKLRCFTIPLMASTKIRKCVSSFRWARPMESFLLAASHSVPATRNISNALNTHSPSRNVLTVQRRSLFSNLTSSWEKPPQRQCTNLNLLNALVLAWRTSTLLPTSCLNNFTNNLRGTYPAIPEMPDWLPPIIGHFRQRQE